MEKPEIYSFDLTRKTGKNIHLHKGNQMISSNDRIHYHIKRLITAHLRNLAKIEGEKRNKTLAPYNEDKPCHVIVTVSAPTNAKSDIPNLYPTVKALIDGLTDAGVWEDDNNNIIKSLTFIKGPKTTNKKYHIELHIKKSTINLNELDKLINNEQKESSI